ncbi:MAG: EF-hand domain-containing protein [Candidatus Obscuribacterales bacterium]|nr:EF-hand domain-containing protein [Candidatus Obscuribacterales bacterium]
MRQYKTLLLTAGALVFAGTMTGIQAQDASAQTSPDQVEAVLSQKFDALDVDKSGTVSKTEFIEKNKGPLIDSYMGLDTNGDGAVSKEEFAAATAQKSAEEAEADFKVVDANNDGSCD